MTENNLHQYYIDYGFLETPVVGCATGLTAFGLYGCLAGAALGIIDELGYRYGYYSTPHLSAGFLGSSMMYSFSSKKTLVQKVMSENGQNKVVYEPQYPFKEYATKLIILGASGGMAVSAGLFADHTALLNKMTRNVVLSSKMYGLQGGVAATIITGAEELLQKYNISVPFDFTGAVATTAFTHFSLSLLGRGVIDSIGNQIIPLQVAVFAVGGWAFRDSDYSLEFTKIYQDLAQAYDITLQEEQYERLVKGQVLYTVSLSYVAQTNKLNIMIPFQSLSTLAANAESIDLIKVAPMIMSELRTAITPMLMFISASGLSEMLRTHQSVELALCIQHESTPKIFDGQNLLKLFSSANFSTHETQINRYHLDVTVIAKNGMSLLSSSMQVTTEGVISLGAIINANALDLATIFLGINYFYNLALAKVADLPHDVRFHSNELIAQNAKIQQNFLSNVKEITLSGGDKNEIAKLDDLYSQLRLAYEEMDIKFLPFKMVSQLVGWSNGFIQSGLVVMAISGKSLSLSSRIMVGQGLDDIYKFLSFSANSAAERDILQQSINQFSALMMASSEVVASTGLVRRTLIDEPKLILHNISLSLPNSNSSFLNIDHMEFDFGKSYGLVGKSGCGKSSTLSKVMGLDHDGVVASGTISYPKDYKISYMSQKTYIPIESTLLEVMVYPRVQNDLNSEELKMVSSLSKLLGFQDELLHVRDDWGRVLSGGEQKKVAIIRAVLSHSNIVVLDEVFVGMDAASKYLVQDLIKQHLKGALIITIDHHAADNNLCDFYDKIVNFCGEDGEAQEVGCGASFIEA